MDVYSPSGPLPNIPDDLTVPQFIFAYQHECRPVRGPSSTWLIEDETGREIGKEEIIQSQFGQPIDLEHGANPDFSSDELFYQLEQTKASLIIVHPDSIDTAHSAAQKAKLPLNRLVMFDTPPQSPDNYLKIGALIHKGLTSLPAFVERKLNSGEAKTKLAFLSFLSGTTE
ncbi:hypothetical protein C0992_005030, partial [Termitomyces sp. T32_za158]